MHHVTVTTTNDTGGVVASTGDVIAGHHNEAVAHAAYRALTATLRLHESSAPQAHHHLIALDDDPLAIIAVPLGPAHQVDIDTVSTSLAQLTAEHTPHH